MLPKRLIALTLLASALAVMPACGLRAQWVQTGPIQQFNDIVVGTFYASGPIMLAATEQGVFSSSDSGTTWELDTECIGNLYAYAFILIGNKYFAETDSGLYVSQNNFGWTLSNHALRRNLQQSNYSLLVYDSVLFAGTTFSRDTGRTWIVDSSGTGKHEGEFFAANDSFIFSGGPDYLYRSSNEGGSWDRLDSMPFQMSGLVVHDSILIAFGASVARSDDNGIHWVNDTTGLYNPTPGIVSPFAGWALSDLVISDSNLVGIQIQFDTAKHETYPKVFRSSFYQNGWLQGTTFYGNQEGFNYGVSCMTSQGNMVFVSTAMGLFTSSDNGDNWFTEELPLSVTEYVGIRSLAMIGSNVFAGSDGDNGYSETGIFLSTDQGIDWLDSPLYSEPINCLAVSENNLIAGTNIGIAVSTNGGMNWILMPSNKIISIGADGPNVFACSSGVLYHSSNAGLSWVTPALNYNIDNIDCVAIHGNTVLVSIGNDGTIRSDDNGNTWNIDTIGLTDEISQFAFCGNLIIASGQDPFSSTDDVETWNKVVVIQWNFDQLWPTVFGVSGNDVLATTYYGLNLSSDGGIDWAYDVDFNTPFRGAETSFLFEDSNLIVGTFGGIWRGKFSEIIPTQSSVSKVGQIENGLNNFPNPFTQSTQISFTSESAGYADLSIVNLLGEQVARIFSGELDEGPHNFTFGNTAALPDGTYECLLRMNGQVETLPIVLLH